MYRLYKRIQHFHSTGVPKLSHGYGSESNEKDTESNEKNEILQTTTLLKQTKRNFIENWESQC